MVYLLNGNIYQIKEYINTLIKDNNIDEININKYELDAYNYKNVLEDASSISLFEDNKMIIVSNASIFSSSNKTIPLEPFEEYLSNPNPNTILVFILEEKIDERKKVTKLIRKNGYVKEYSDINDIPSFIKEILGNYKIKDDALAEFIKLVDNNTYNIINELEKLKLYKDNDLVITKDDVLNVTTKNVDVDLFKLMDAIMDNNKDLALKYYDNMLIYNTEPIQIIIALANKYRLMYQVKTLKTLGYTDNDIARELKQSPNYIYVLNKLSKSYNDNYLLEQLKTLASLDYNIKSGNIDSKLGLELYILKK